MVFFSGCYDACGKDYGITLKAYTILVKALYIFNIGICYDTDNVKKNVPHDLVINCIKYNKIVGHEL